MGKRPSFQFYPGDWLRDGVAGCSLAAQGLWLRMLLIAHDSERYGYLQSNGKPIPSSSLARRIGADSTEQYLTLLQELDDAQVPGRTPEGIIYSRRMVRDEKTRQATNVRVQKHRSNGDCNARVTAKYEDEDEEEKEVRITEIETKPLTARKDKTGTRIPEGFKVTDEVREFARANQLPDPDLHIAEFLDYWAAQPGQKGIKLDWPATFRNWLRRVPNFQHGRAYDRNAQAEGRGLSKSRQRVFDNRKAIVAGLGYSEEPGRGGADLQDGTDAGRGAGMENHLLRGENSSD